MHACQHRHLPAAAAAAQVLYDLGVVSTKEPFARLVSQGMILGEVEYTYCLGPDGKECREDDHDATVVKVGVMP